MDYLDKLLNEGIAVLQTRKSAGHRLLYDHVDSISYHKWVLNCISFLGNDAPEQVAQIKTVYKPNVALHHQAEQIFAILNSAVEFIRSKKETSSPDVAPTKIKKETMKTGAVFIGHGRSREWLALQNFLKDRLHLQCVEFNTESAAGLATTERLSELLNQAVFAFLVMTAEDEQADGSKRARENVVHEAGLFQGRLTFKKAIVVLEEGCVEFSNIHGLGQIRFQKGQIESCYEEVRKVLEREKVLKSNQQ